MKTEYYIEREKINWGWFLGNLITAFAVFFSLSFTAEILILNNLNAIIVFPSAYFIPLAVGGILSVVFCNDEREKFHKTIRIPVQKSKCKKGGEGE